MSCFKKIVFNLKNTVHIKQFFVSNYIIFQ